ncbi:kelch repeat-containing protein [uncultured Maribacter sp.]|uniref:Kelch repeat-containing protein n=1 Tax=uncultured Maribacter sp. TaxID=431308 RepID=UPI002617FCD3|nr:kelch repeat-containing protein [uncultured Maribacter sp.]
MKRFLLGLMAFQLLVTSCEEPKKKASKENMWQYVTTVDQSEPVPRHEAAFVGVKDKFYLLGGRGIRPVSIYDNATSTWSNGAKPPIEIHHFQPVVHKNLVYVIGAMTGGYPDETPVPNIYIYNVSNDNWTIGDSIPRDRLRGSTGNVIYNNKVYISCGIKNGHIGEHKKWLDTYDLKTRKWQILPDAPMERDHFQAAIVGHKMYLLGGRQSKAPDETFKHTIAEVCAFDFQEEKWEILPNNLPTMRAGNMVTPIHEYIWVIGGESDNQSVAHNEVEVLNTKTKIWEKKPALLRGRHGSGIVVYKNACYVASGSGNKGGSPELKSMEKFVFSK